MHVLHCYINVFLKGLIKTVKKSCVHSVKLFPELNLRYCPHYPFEVSSASWCDSEIESAMFW